MQQKTKPNNIFNSNIMSRAIRLKPGEALKEGIVTLIGSTGKAYRNRALEIPGYGMVPCSRRLRDNFTNDSSKLIVMVDDDDQFVTSSIWVTLNN